MVILGLTGSIGMGKTVAANYFRQLGVAVHDSDQAVHRLLAPGGKGVEPVARAFPGVLCDGAIDRKELGAIVFDDDAALKSLEAILHPLVRLEEHRFLAAAARRRRPEVVLDVPLLFETGGEARCDAVVTVSAPPFVQAARVLSRPGMTRERLDAVLERQMPDAEKCRRSDFVVRTGLGRSQSLRAVREIVSITRTWQGANWPIRTRTPRQFSTFYPGRAGER